MAEILDMVDLEALRKEVREKYREVAENPTAEYHFHTGRPHAIGKEPGYGKYYLPARDI